MWRRRRSPLPSTAAARYLATRAERSGGAHCAYELLEPRPQRGLPHARALHRSYHVPGRPRRLPQSQCQRTQGASRPHSNCRRWCVFSNLRHLNADAVSYELAVINNILVPIRRMQMTTIEYALLQAIILFDCGKCRDAHMEKKTEKRGPCRMLIAL